jgi:hypothetical protein
MIRLDLSTQFGGRKKQAPREASVFSIRDERKHQDLDEKKSARGMSSSEAIQNR